MSITINSAVDFYERHPISAQIILTKLEAARGSLDDLKPDELYPHDQDHYGGLAANDAIAQAAQMKPGMRVADFCAGLGGPARYWAHRYGLTVTGIELTPARVAGAADLTRRVGLQDRVRVLAGNVMSVPLPDASQDAVVSQEAFLHVPDVPRTLAEAFRILVPGGRIAFTTWTAPKPLSAADQKLMWDGMAVQKIYSFKHQCELLREAGFADVTADDLSASWTEILTERMAMYQKLRAEAVDAAAPAGHDAFYASYVLLVDLIKSGGLGGGRFSAAKPV
jgi:sarcosine/dimethylglycine N-methyltransferase